jgi:hypothetical protein
MQETGLKNLICEPISVKNYAKPVNLDIKFDQTIETNRGSMGFDKSLLICCLTNTFKIIIY